MKDEAKWKVAGDFLRSKRNELGLSIFKVARAIGVSGNYISLIERGLQAPSKSIIYSLSEFYSIDYSQLMAFYGKFENDDMTLALTNPFIRKMLIEFSQEKRFNEEEREKIAKEMYDMAMDIISKRK